LVAVGLFGGGAFAHTLLILLATQKLTPTLGATGAASAAVALYLLHNVFYASFALIGGWIADRVKKNIVLAVGYSMAALMAIAIMTLPVSIWTFALVFILGGTNVALEETAEDSFCAELVREEHHGMAFGLLATVNGVGDFFSSVIVGLLWTAFGTTIAFGYSAILSIIGALLVARIRSRPTDIASGAIDS
jgi:MFS family permease